VSKQEDRGTETKPPARLIAFPTAERPVAPQAARRRWGLATSVVLLLLVAAGAGWWALREGDPVRYVTAPVTVGPIHRTVTATGTINPVLTIMVGTYVSGVIQELYCDYNTQVKRGQVCAKIDDRPFRTVVDQAKANLAVAAAQLEKDKASLAYAKGAYERAAQLVHSNAVSRDAHDNARSVYEQAVAQIAFDEATIAQRQAMLDGAQVNLDYTRIVSPVDGTVVSRNVTMGQTVAASFQTPTLFLIATDLTRMQVDTNVSESDIGGIMPGHRGMFTVDAFPKRTFEGVVSQVRQSPQTVQNVVTYDVVVGVANDDLALKPGLTATTRLIIDERNDVVRIPNPALRYTPGGLAGPSRHAAPADTARVWVLRNGAPVAVPVGAGLDDDSFTEIIGGGLNPGDQVITAETREPSRARSAVPRPRL
jgi:HlyD family secretion protein